MSEWKTYKLGDLPIQFIDGDRGKNYPKGEDFSEVGHCLFLNAGNVTKNGWNFSESVYISQEKDNLLRNGKLERGDIVLTTRGTVGNVVLYSDDIPYKHIRINSGMVIIRNNNTCYNPYLYQYLRSYLFLGQVQQFQSGSAQPQIPISTLKKLTISLPPLAEQKRIADILSAIDDKIELNRRINANLKQQAQALFDEYFIHNIGKLGNYSTASLTDIAQFLNGLAMQKFRPKDGKDGIPVLKIKELGQGKCDASSDLCSSSIPEEYIINNGDIVFSWSGTLLVDIWCSGICGLNQHLFKVSPLNYPKWLIYFWTKYHLSNFIRIAQDKAVTMGHIKRGDLDAAKVIIPSDKSLNELDKIMSPMLQSIISNRIGNNNLSTLRDTLLPKLMSGEITV